MRSLSSRFQTTSLVLCGLLSAVVWTATGCGGSANSIEPSVPFQHAGLAAKVMGGRQPISNSSILLSEVGAFGRGTSNGLANAQSDSNGNFNITSFTCQSQNSQLFITASGGDAGNGYNSNIFLVAMLGPCNNLPNNVVINELSTVAAAYAFNQGMSRSNPQQVGANATPAQPGYIGMTNAGTLLSTNLVNIASGTASAFLNKGKNSPKTLNTLADLLVVCVNAPVGFSACQDLFTAATPPGGGSAPQNTLQAIFDISSNPGNNVAALFNLLSTDFPTGLAKPYGPILTAAPNDWLIALNYAPTDLSGAQDLTIDLLGNVWITNATGGANHTGSVTELSPVGVELSPAGGYLAGNTLSAPGGLFADGNGNIWVLDPGVNTVIALNDLNGSVAVPSNGNETFGPTSLATDSFNQIWVTNSTTTDPARELTVATTTEGFSFFGTGFGLNDPTRIVGDTTVTPNIMWVANTGTGGVSQIINNGTSTLSGAAIAGGGQQDQQGIALDTQGNVWVANANSTAGSVTKISGTSVALGPIAVGGITSTSMPWGVTTDTFDNVWVTNSNGNSITALNSSGVALSPSGGYTAGGLINGPKSGIAFDRGGNLWILNEGNNTVTEILGAGNPVATPRVTGRPLVPSATN